MARKRDVETECHRCGDPLELWCSGESKCPSCDGPCPCCDGSESTDEVDYDETREDWDDTYSWTDPTDGSTFADPGGRSALRAATPSNPRNLPCPTCGKKNRLTPADVQRGYQCDECADRAELGLDY